MKRRQVLLDDASERILASLAEAHAGNKSLAVREALKAREAVEDLLDRIENAQYTNLRVQKERSEAGFRQGRFITWEHVKRRNRL